MRCIVVVEHASGDHAPITMGLARFLDPPLGDPVSQPVAAKFAFYLQSIQKGEGIPFAVELHFAKPHGTRPDQAVDALTFHNHTEGLEFCSKTDRLVWVYEKAGDELPVEFCDQLADGM